MLTNRSKYIYLLYEIFKGFFGFIYFKHITILSFV